MMKPGRIGIVRPNGTSRPQNVTEVSVVILDMFLTAKLKLVFPEAEDAHYCIIKRLGLFDVRDCYIDVVDSDDFGHIRVEP